MFIVGKIKIKTRHLFSTSLYVLYSLTFRLILISMWRLFVKNDEQYSNDICRTKQSRGKTYWFSLIQYMVVLILLIHCIHWSNLSVSSGSTILYHNTIHWQFALTFLQFPTSGFSNQPSAYYSAHFYPTFCTCLVFHNFSSP